MQGLYVTSDCRRGCGEVLYSCQLPAGVVAAAADTAARLGLTLTLYSAERIVCKETDAQTDRLLPYREPTPEAPAPCVVVVPGSGFEQAPGIIVADGVKERRSRAAAT